MDNIYTKEWVSHGTCEHVYNITTQRFMLIDNVETKVGTQYTFKVTPGEFDRVKEQAPSLLHFFEEMWTDKVVKSWKRSCGIVEESTPDTIDEEQEL